MNQKALFSAASLLGALGITTAILAGCSAGKQPGEGEPLFQGRAGVRLFQGGIGFGGPVSATFAERGSDPEGLAGNLSFGAVGAAQPVPVADPAVTLTLADSTSLAFSPSAKPAYNQYYLYALAGVRGGSGTLAPALLAIPDRPAPPASPAPAPASGLDKAAFLRIVHLSPDAPAVDLFTSGATAPTPVPAPTAEPSASPSPTPSPGPLPTGSVVGLTDVRYKGYTSYVPVASGVVQLSLRESAGSATFSAPTLLKPTFLDAKRFYTLYIVGMRNPATGQESLDARLVAEEN